MKNIKNLFAYFLLLIFVLAGCSTVRKTTDLQSISQLPDRKSDLKTLQFKASLSVSFPKMNQNVVSDVMLSGADSAKIDLTGPFSVPVGKFFANQNKFYFYNTMENVVIEGKPTSENMQQTMMIPLSFSDFARLLRVETPGDPSEFQPVERYPDKKNILFRNNSGSEYVEYAVYSIEQGNIIQYQRKDRNGNLILNCYYRDFKVQDGYSMPERIVMKFEQIDGKIEVNVKSFGVNDFNPNEIEPSLPQGVKRIKM